jgi:peptidoglycan/xylan/chitin deacetylase (PgdA/CDA1 family)
VALRSLLPPITIAHHGVNRVAGGEDPLDLVMAPEHLESQVRLLQRAGYRFLTAEELLATGRPQARGTAILTFDDGWLDALTVAAPLLHRLGVRATFYVNPGRWGAMHHVVTGDAARLLTADDATALVAAGMELGAHSLHHDDLRTLGDDELLADLSDCRTAIEAVSGGPCRTLAYPFGAYDARVQDAARKAGYGLAWAWLPGPWEDFAAPRLPGPTRHGGSRLALKMLGVRRRRTIGPPPDGEPSGAPAPDPR